jgi:hypothetical protein
MQETQQYLYLLSALIPAFIPVPEKVSDVSLEQVAFRWSLRKYLSFALLEKDGYILPRQFEIYSDAAMKTVAACRARLRHFAAVTNYIEAYDNIPLCESMLLAFENFLGRDKFFALISKHHEELLAS